jgi:hypothetical protein
MPEVQDPTPPTAPAGVDTDQTEQLIESLPVLVKETKAGYKTTEFWLTIGGAILTQLNVLHLPGKYGQVIATVSLLVSYIISRGLAKKGIPHAEVEVGTPVVTDDPVV